MAARSTGMPGGQAVHHDGQRGAVGLSGIEEAQHRKPGECSVSSTARWSSPLLAFLTVLFHLAFILFVIFGGFLVARRPRLAPLHLACAAWGAYVALANRICPLTPLENWFRQRGGAAGYAGDFLEHYLLAVIYPTGLTASTQQGARGGRHRPERRRLRLDAADAAPAPAPRL